MSAIVQRLVFDVAAGEIRDGQRRYVLIRPDVLMGALHELDGATRQRVLEALAASTERNGGRSVHAYASIDRGTALLDTICDTAAGLGWGRWHMSLGADRLDLTVHNSPFAHGHGKAARAVCAPIAGMLGSVAAMLFEGPVRVEETGCAAHVAGPVCRFVARAQSGASLPMQS